MAVLGVLPLRVVPVDGVEVVLEQLAVAHVDGLRGHVGVGEHEPPRTENVIAVTQKTQYPRYTISGMRIGVLALARNIKEGRNVTALQRCLLLLGGLFSLLGCTMPPRQPAVSESFALLKFTASMQLLAIDDQTVDARFSLDTLRVSPGQHVLRFVHVNAGPDGSATHAGQAAAPFTLDVQEGLTYQFEAKT